MKTYPFVAEMQKSDESYRSAQVLSHHWSDLLW